MTLSPIFSFSKCCWFLPIIRFNLKEISEFIFDIYIMSVRFCFVFHLTNFANGTELEEVFIIIFISDPFPLYAIYKKRMISFYRTHPYYRYFYILLPNFFLRTRSLPLPFLDIPPSSPPHPSPFFPSLPRFAVWFLHPCTYFFNSVRRP